MRTTLACLLALVIFDGRSRAIEPRKVAIMVHDGVELLDFAGPGEVFAAAGNGAFDVFTVAPTHAPVVSQGFVKITPNYAIDDSPKPDIIVIPGGHTSALYNDPNVMAWLKARAATAELTMSVCNGAITLAKTGLLDGLKATTHWGALPALRRFPRITVVPEARFVDNGRVMATQGVSAGIDGALHVVERLLGPEAAWSAARYMMYPWEPSSLSRQAKDELRPFIEFDWPKVTAVYERKLAANPSDPVAATRLGIAQKELGDDARAATTLERALALGTHDPDALDELAEAQTNLGRHADAARTYAKELPLRFTDAQSTIGLRLARALARAGDKEAALTQLKRWTASAHVSRADLASDPNLATLRGDPRFTAFLQGVP
jgi:transcriptional regulator GlxA family with amidase domain